MNSTTGVGSTEASEWRGSSNACIRDNPSNDGVLKSLPRVAGRSRRITAGWNARRTVSVVSARESASIGPDDSCS
jgi:hypothetical protein